MSIFDKPGMELQVTTRQVAFGLRIRSNFAAQAN
jgi:hypothetical protein